MLSASLNAEMHLHHQVDTQCVGNMDLVSDGYLTHGPLSSREQKIDLSWFFGTKGSCIAGPVWGNHSPNQRIGRSMGPGLAVDCVECFFQRPGDG